MKIILITICIMLVVVAWPVFSQTMSSSNYNIVADTVNFGGGLATTTNYRINDTMGEAGSGSLSSASYLLKAGYQQMHETYISISAVSDITMSPNIDSSTGGTSNGSGSATVITDSLSGYQLAIKASASPAMVAGANSFADYTPSVVGTPDYAWSVGVTSAEFGFSPESAHLVQKFQDNGSSCNAGASDASSACWYNLDTTNETIALSYSANHRVGTATIVRFRATAGASSSIEAGSYQATITLTALAN